MSAEGGTFPGTPRAASQPAPVAESPSSTGPAGDGVEEQDGLETRILDALRNVVDPELGINIVDLGLVYEVAVQGEKVHIEYTLTTMGCPIGPLIEAQMKQFLDQVPGITEVDAEMVLTPPWTPDKMSEEAQAALGMI
ncbi:MAG TPA: metal-sulfur cluster assembly factor [Actinomycetota bacterium]|jgi:metal-sulfur cluster biosynthetic enzyme|nr:metal-sulfur cluster assembly factor [Actinomycetota bacterium]